MSDQRTREQTDWDRLTESQRDKLAGMNDAKAVALLERMLEKRQVRAGRLSYARLADIEALRMAIHALNKP